MIFQSFIYIETGVAVARCVNSGIEISNRLTNKDDTNFMTMISVHNGGQRKSYIHKSNM